MTKVKIVCMVITEHLLQPGLGLLIDTVPTATTYVVVHSTYMVRMEKMKRTGIRWGAARTIDFAPFSLRLAMLDTKNARIQTGLTTYYVSRVSSEGSLLLYRVINNKKLALFYYVAKCGTCRWIVVNVVYRWYGDKKIVDYKVIIIILWSPTR